jgi:hypothetical protein
MSMVNGYLTRLLVQRSGVIRVVKLIGACVMVAGCNVTPPPAPTANSIPMAQTAQYQTQMAPPKGFEQRVSFPKIDDRLSDQPGWHYTLTLSFDGVESDSGDKATGQIAAEIFSNEQAGERRLLLTLSGKAFGVNEDRKAESVRIRDDYYVVNANKVCSKVEKTGAGQLADLSAGVMLGGIKQAIPAVNRKTDQGVDVWEYTFSPDDVNPPTFQFDGNGAITIAAGDLWVAPSLNAVWQYTISFNLQRAILQSGAKPVTGQLRATYQLIEAGQTYNIAIPFGC